MKFMKMKHLQNIQCVQYMADSLLCTCNKFLVENTCMSELNDKNTNLFPVFISDIFRMDVAFPARPIAADSQSADLHEPPPSGVQAPLQAEGVLRAQV